METDDWRSMLIAAIAHFAVWISRTLLKLLMYFGHGVCCFLLRHMEYDADSYEIKLAGTEAFERTLMRISVLGEARGDSLRAMQAAWKIKNMLPDNFPAFLMLQASKMPPARREQIENTVGLSRAGIFSSHPSAGDRIRRARQAAEPGIFTWITRRHFCSPILKPFPNRSPTCTIRTTSACNSKNPPCSRSARQRPWPVDLRGLSPHRLRTGISPKCSSSQIGMANRTIASRRSHVHGRKCAWMG